MEYKYKVNISNNRVIYLRELTVEEYKNLQKICIDSDISIFKEYVINMITHLSGQELELNIIDIYRVVLEIRRYSISDEKMFTTYIDGKAGGISITIDQLIDPVIEIYDEFTNRGFYEIELDDFVSECVVIDPFDVDNIIKGFKSGDKIYNIPEINDIVPLSIKNQIDEKIDVIYEKFSDILLFTLTTENGGRSDVKFDLNSDFIYSFLKIIIKDNLKSFYRNIFDMKKQLNIGFDEHRHMTLSEMDLYISMFNSDVEKENQKQAENKNQTPV